MTDSSKSQPVFPRQSRSSRPRSRISSYLSLPRESHAKEAFLQPNARSTSPRPNYLGHQRQLPPLTGPSLARTLPARNPRFQDDHRRSAPPIATPSTTRYRLQGVTSCASHPAEIPLAPVVPLSDQTPLVTSLPTSSLVSPGSRRAPQLVWGSFPLLSFTTM